MKRMAKSRGDNLCKGGTQRAGLIGCFVGLHSQVDVVGAQDMTEFMNHGTLLCHHQQQQQAYDFEHFSHSNWHQPLSLESDFLTLTEC
ncbi:MAG: hypothetical protein ABSH33_12490 [Steroidobacteraceae bacterium]|jgi:hypothetical protein